MAPNAKNTTKKRQNTNCCHHLYYPFNPTQFNMSFIPVKIKHSGKTYDLDVDLQEPGLTFKLQIYSVTNVVPEKQKVLLKGGQLKDDSDLQIFNLKPNQVIMVLGTPEEKLPTAPAEQLVFIEDLEKTNKNLAKTDVEPTGLVNLGNTCYLNSSLQSLFTVKEVQDKLSTFVKQGNEPTENLIYFLRQLFEKMGQKDQDVPPLNFLTTLRLTFPQFAEQDQQNGFYKQQDAEEAYSQILSLLTNKLPGLLDYFRIEFKTTTKCLETDEEPAIGFEDATKLSCHISIKTNFLKNGLIESLNETIDKNNESLGRNAQYEVSRKITRLPKYLNVNFVRFFWKRETGKKSKILRKVQFPFQLDLLDLLDDSIKLEKSLTRDKIYEVEKANEDEGREFRKTKRQKLETRFQIEDEKSELTNLRKKWVENFHKVLPQDFNLESGENPSSLYELKAIVTHQGASADSGHYQAFVKDDDDITGERWWKFNDNKVSVVTREKIEQLAGGGESDSALILSYKAVGL